MYKVQKDKENNRFEVVELATEQTIDTFDKYADAYKIYRFMQEGGAFAGWSPSFIFVSAKGKKT
jgi:hypothetical protein